MRFGAVLLAGGKSSRMGRDKALLEFRGEPLWRRQLQTLRDLSPNELFLAGPYHDPAVETIADEMAGGGPLAAVAAALGRLLSPHLVVLAVDLPLMTTAFLRSLLQLCGPRRGVVARRGDRFEPLAAVYAKRSLQLAAAALRDGQFSMQSFIGAAIEQDLFQVRDISDEEAPLFANLNTPDDLAAL
jgi:molybdopterin-guanine dinucleotide biosynthesis protein A